jgi:hypothetical protein
MPTPEAFPTHHLGGPRWRRCYQLEPEFPTVLGPKYVDGGQDTFISFTTPTRRWVIEYDQLIQPEFELLDGHYSDAQGVHLGFEFTDPDTGITYQNVKYEKFDRPAHNVKTIQARVARLIKRP